MTRLEVRSLSKRSRDVIRYEDISFVCEAGDVVAFIGPSGGGKSSLFCGICGLDLPDRGTITAGGRTLFEADASHRRVDFDSTFPDVTMVLQDFPLFPHLRITQNVSLPSAGRGDGPEVPAMLLERLGLQPLLKRFPHQLSVGQRQRVALARGLSLRPSILVLDEPTSAQDVHNTKRIAELIEGFKATGGAVLLASHALGLVRRLATKVLFISEGKCLEHGSVEILDAPEHQELREFLAVWNAAEVQGRPSRRLHA